MKKRAGAVKGKKTAIKTKRKTVKAKGNRRSGGSAGFTLTVPAALAKNLAAVAEKDSSFKGNNPKRYAINELKNIVSNAKI